MQAHLNEYANFKSQKSKITYVVLSHTDSLAKSILLRNQYVNACAQVPSHVTNN